MQMTTQNALRIRGSWCKLAAPFYFVSKQATAPKQLFYAYSVSCLGQLVKQDVQSEQTEVSSMFAYMVAVSGSTLHAELASRRKNADSIAKMAPVVPVIVEFLVAIVAVEDCQQGTCPVRGAVRQGQTADGAPQGFKILSTRSGGFDGMR